MGKSKPNYQLALLKDGKIVERSYMWSDYLGGLRAANSFMVRCKRYIEAIRHVW